MPPFQHRALLGWISEFIRRPLPGVWPQIPLDDETLADLDACFRLCRETGYNTVILWGLFVDRCWPLDIASCMDTDRKARVAQVITAAKAQGLTILGGVGLYSWGFETILNAHPELCRTNPQVLCPALAGSHVWMEAVLSFILEDFALDGLSFQSADQGRCLCRECRVHPDLEYHARLNERAARWVRARLPDKILWMDTWGCPLTAGADLAPLVQASALLDAVIDTDNSAERVGENFRKAVIGSLNCAFGTLAGLSVWPPQRWERDKWFLPTTLINAAYLRRLSRDGGTAAEQFITALANPSGEITLRFMAALLKTPEADPMTLLREAVSRVYAPQNFTILERLTAIVLEAETAYFGADAPDNLQKPELLCIDGGFHHSQWPNPETYLIRLEDRRLRAYRASLARLGDEFNRLRPFLGETEKADLTLRCFRRAEADAARIAQERGASALSEGAAEASVPLLRPSPPR